MDINTVVKKNGLVGVFGYMLGDYDWSEIGVYFSSEKNRYFWYTDSGCSCTYFGDNVGSMSEFCDGDKFAASRAIYDFVKSEEGESGASVQAAKFLMDN